MLKKPGKLRDEEILWVIAPVYNPVRFHSRYRLYEQFRDRLRNNPNVRLVTVEVAFGDRRFEVTDPGNSDHIQLRTSQELWLKESSLNLAVNRLPESAKYISWTDADIHFTHEHWATEVLHNLQHYDIVQNFTHAVDLGPRGEVLGQHVGFGYMYATGGTPKSSSYYEADKIREESREIWKWHPGLSWSCRRDAFDRMGGLVDWTILGAADHHMAFCWIGQGERSVKPGMSAGYVRRLRSYNNLCERVIKRNIGYIDGTVLHYHHGPKALRFYNSRHKLLLKHGFDPDLHLRREASGLYALDPDMVGLRDDIRAYHRAREEDSTEV